MTSQETTLSRRTLAKGAAWAAPVVAASAAAPAYAVSPAKCPSTGAPIFVGAAKFHWGYLGKTDQEQQLLLFSRLQITNVSVGSIASVKVDYVIEQRADGTNSPGAPIATASTSNWADKTVYTSSQTGMTTKGATGVLSQTATSQSIKYADSGASEVYTPDTGTAYNSYILSYELTNFSDSYYTQGSTDCTATFDTSSGDLNSLSNTGTPIEIKWSGQTAPSSVDTNSLHITTHWTYTLVDGRSYEVVETVLPTQPAANTAQFSNTGW